MSNKHPDSLTLDENESNTESPVGAKEVTLVEMEDGRKVEFAGKRQMLKETSTEHGKASVRFDFRNGKTRTYHVPHDDLLRHAAHGASQKIGDETSGVKDVDDMVVAVDEMISRLSKGEWKAQRVSTGNSFAGASVVIQAIMEVTGKSAEDVKKYLEGKLASNPTLTRPALYASFRVPTSKTGVVITRIEAEKAAKKGTAGSADNYLAELAELAE